MRDFTDEAFLDGVINGSERKTIENYIYQINTVLAQVQQSYNEVIDNTFLIDSVAKTNLTNSYNDFVTATNELIANIDDISKQSAVSNIDRATFEVKYTNFNSKYSDYTKYLNAAIKFIEYAINSKVDDTITALGGYSYLKDALDNEKTTVTGGLVLTTLLALGYTNENKEYVVNAGINGNSPKSNDIVIWAGGSNIDKLLEPNNPKAADFLVRGDGTGYAAGGNFWWESDGTIHANPLSFVISENSVGALLSSFQVVYNVENGKPQPTYITPKVPFTTITVASDINLNNNAKISFGDVYMSYDNANNAIYFANTKGQVVNFYTSGSISMLSGTDLNVPSIFKDIPIDNQTIYWENGVLKAAGGGGGGGTADSVAWANITGKPNFAAVATSGSYSDLSGKPTLLSSFTNDLGFITSLALSDYLPKSGGILSAAANNVLSLNSTIGYPSLEFRNNGAILGRIVMGDVDGSLIRTNAIWSESYVIWDAKNFNPSNYLPKTGGTLSGELNINGQLCLNSCFLLSATDGNWKVTDKNWQNEYKLWHTGNFNPSDYLPKSGGTISGTTTGPLNIDTTSTVEVGIPLKMSSVTKGWLGYNSTAGTYLYNNASKHYLGIKDDGSIYYDKGTILHSGNYSSYALPLTGGVIKGNLQVGSDDNTNYYEIRMRRGGTNAFMTVAGSQAVFGCSDGYQMRVSSEGMFYNTPTDAKTIIHSGNIGSQSVSYASSAGDAQILSTTKASGITNDVTFKRGFLPKANHTDGNWGSPTGTYDSGEYAMAMRFADGKYYHELWFNLNESEPYWRQVVNGVSKGWRKFAFTDSNVASATKLQTARTIWGQSFDGTGNVSGMLIFDNTHYIKTDSSGLFLYNATASNFIEVYDNTNIVLFGGNVGIGTTSPAYKLDVNGTLGVSGATTLSSTLWVTGATSLNSGLSLNGAIVQQNGKSHFAYASYADPAPGLDMAIKVCGGFAQSAGNVLLCTSGSYNVGIGTTSPVDKLHIYRADTGDCLRLSSGTTWANVVYQPSQGNVWSVGAQSDGRFAFWCSSVSTHVVSIYGNGNVLTSGSITMNSMRSMKNIINENGLSLEELSTIKPTRFTWKDGRDDRIHVGGIADDVMKVLPEVVFKGSDGVLSMDYASAAFAIGASLIKPVSEHELKIKELERESELLKKEIELLKSA